MMDPLRPEFMHIYGPPRSRRKRIVNRFRRMFGYEEQWEVYYTLAVDYANNSDRTMRVAWDKSGVLTIDDVTGDKERPDA